MLAYALKRSFAALLILIVVSGLTFSLSHLSADPALTIGGAQASDEDIAAIRELYGFDRPVYVQYFEWAGRALIGDFGSSYHYGERVSVMIYDMLGRHVTTLINSEEQDAGKHALVWNGRNNAGTPVASGVYFVHFKAGSFTHVQKLTKVH